MSTKRIETFSEQNECAFLETHDVDDNHFEYQDDFEDEQSESECSFDAQKNHDNTILYPVNDIISDSEDDCDRLFSSNHNEFYIDANECLEDFSLIADALENDEKSVELNKTFSEMQLRDIERKNMILMNKILSHSKRMPQYKTEPLHKTVSSSSINRKRNQTKVDNENLRLLKKINSIKPFGLSRRT